jgi:H+-transporting ATPase
LDLILVIVAGGVMLITGTSTAFLLTFTLMLLVLSVPIALPAMSTLSATMGVGALAKMGVLTTRLSAIEDAAAMDTLCIDKTGTLTENKPRVGKVLSLSNYSESEILYYVARTVDISNQEPINAALKQAAEERKLLKDTKDQDIVFEAFDPKIKSSGAWINEDGKKIHIIKGEPVALAKLTGTLFKNIEDKVLELSKNGDRVVAVGIGDDTKVKIAGLISLTDPILTDSKELVFMVKGQGIRVVLLTGDGKKTAQSVAEQVGIIGETAPENIDYKKIGAKEVEKYSVFPRVFPEDKYFIVKAFQKAGHVVGMTGDGVNDAPALKQASVGIATANATDVAKSSAGLILTQPGLANIPAMIKISRGIHRRMHTWILAMITRKLAVPTFITFGLLIFKEPVITPSLAFLFMLFGDIVTFSLSKDNVVPSTKPDHWDMKPIVIRGSIYAFLMFVMSLGMFWFARSIYHMSLPQTQTIIFAWLVLVAGQAALYLVRNQKAFWEKPYPSSWLLGTTILTFLITAFMSIGGLLMRPISITWFGIILVSAFGYLMLGNIANLFLKEKPIKVYKMQYERG